MNEIYGMLFQGIDKKAYDDYMELQSNLSKAGDRAMVSISSELLKGYLIEIYVVNSKVIDKDLTNMTFFQIMNMVRERNLISEKEYNVINSVRKIRNIFVHSKYLMSFIENTEIIAIINNTEVIDDAVLFEDIMKYDDDGRLKLQALCRRPKKDLEPRDIFDRIIIDLYFRLFMRKKFNREFCGVEIPMYGLSERISTIKSIE